MQADPLIQVVTAAIIVGMNCLTIGIGVRACRDVYRRIRALEARTIAPPQVMYVPIRPDYYSPPPTAPMAVTYDPV